MEKTSFGNFPRNPSQQHPKLFPVRPRPLLKALAISFQLKAECWRIWFHHGISCFILQLPKVGSLEVHGSVHLMSTGSSSLQFFNSLKWVQDRSFFGPALLSTNISDVQGFVDRILSEAGPTGNVPHCSSEYPRCMVYASSILKPFEPHVRDPDIWSR